MEYQGSCHCGAIRFQFIAAPIQSGLRCNCSLCLRCGIYPFHETLRKADHYRVNLGCVDDLDVLALPVEVLEGRHLLPGAENFSPDP